MRRRARPLLGTLVEVRACGVDTRADAGRFDAAADAAFRAVDQIQRLMSFHDAASDVRRIARARVGERVTVHAHTAAVLRRAQRWARASGGAFDAGCAARAVAAGWLPAPLDGVAPGAVPFEDALQVDGREIAVRAPVWLDFGGIAKGYAVDRAVAALRRAGLASGTVNAGGDLRVFGAQEETVLVRSPFDAAELWPVAALRDGACATSASGQVAVRDAVLDGVDAVVIDGGRIDVGAGVDDRFPMRDDDHADDDTAAARDGIAAPRSVTVFAPTACAADALTKIVWRQGPRAARLLRAARAQAFVVHADGSVWRG